MALADPGDRSLVTGGSRVRSALAILAVGFAVSAIGLDRSWVLWSPHAPWIPDVYQSANVGICELAMAILAVAGMFWPGDRGYPPSSRPPLIVTAASGGGLLAAIGLSALTAAAPILAVARLGQLLTGLLACLALVWRPRLAGWVRLGFLALVLIQLPFVALQIATQSTFPNHSIISDGFPETAASQAGASVVIRADGSRVQRATGTFPHPNVLGGFLALALALALPLLSLRSRFGRLMLATWLIGAAELALTFSRAAALAAAIGLLIWLVARREVVPRSPRPKINVWVVTTALVCVVAVLSRPILAGAVDRIDEPAVSDRLLLATVAVDFIRAHPLTGVGGGNFSLAELAPPNDAVKVDPVHIVPLLVAAEAGLPAGLFWIALVIAPAMIALLGRPRDRDDRASKLAVVAVIFVISVLDHYFWTLAPGRAMFWLALGAGALR
jgi:uncharacterized membrane protein YidH (DUF202 family)